MKNFENFKISTAKQLNALKGGADITNTTVSPIDSIADLRVPPSIRGVVIDKKP